MEQKDVSHLKFTKRMEMVSILTLRILEVHRVKAFILQKMPNIVAVVISIV